MSLLVLFRGAWALTISASPGNPLCNLQAATPPEKNPSAAVRSFILGAESSKQKGNSGHREGRGFSSLPFLHMGGHSCSDLRQQWVYPTQGKPPHRHWCIHREWGSWLVLATQGALAYRVAMHFCIPQCSLEHPSYSILANTQYYAFSQCKHLHYLISGSSSQQLSEEDLPPWNSSWKPLPC